MEWPEIRAKIRERIIAETQNTVGWLEAENKDSFTVGMTIALDKALAELDLEHHRHVTAQQEADRHRTNMETLVNIQDQYRREY